MVCEFRDNDQSSVGLDVCSGDYDGDGIDEVIAGNWNVAPPNLWIWKNISPATTQPSFVLKEKRLIYGPEFGGGVRPSFGK